MKILKVAGMLAVITVLGVFFTGCGRCGWHNKSPEKRINFVMDRISSELDLTKEQQVKLEVIKTAVVSAVNEVRKDREKIHNDALALVKKDKVTNAEVEEFFNIREAQYRKIKPVIVEQFKQFLEILTPEQKEKLAVLMEKHHKCRNN